MSALVYIGSIVEVTNLGKQGQVVGFLKSDKETALVWMGKELDYLIDVFHRNRLDPSTCVTPPAIFNQDGDELWRLRVRPFPPKELTVCSTWSMKTLAERYFKNSYHHYREPERLFVPGECECGVHDCPNRTTQRIIFNIHGTLDFADVCTKCAECYGFKMMDLFPSKKKATA